MRKYINPGLVAVLIAISVAVATLVIFPMPGEDRENFTDYSKSRPAITPPPDRIPLDTKPKNLLP